MSQNYKFGHLSINYNPLQTLHSHIIKNFELYGTKTKSPSKNHIQLIAIMPTVSLGKLSKT